MHRKISVRIEVHVSGSKLAGFRYKPEQLLRDEGRALHLGILLNEVVPAIRAAALYALNENNGVGVRGA